MSKNGGVNRAWLEKRMDLLGFSYNTLKKDFHFSPDTITGWEEGRAWRPYTLRKLARILEVPYKELVQNLGLWPRSDQRRKASKGIGKVDKG